jgi:hypothetical protein
VKARLVPGFFVAQHCDAARTIHATGVAMLDPALSETDSDMMARHFALLMM